MTTQGTLCFIEKDGKYLMQFKKSTKFGGGRWNAPGGKTKENESVEDGVAREILEETGLNIRSVKKQALLNFYNADEFAWAVHVFTTDDFEGEIRDSEEGELKWMDKNSLPYAQMWEDDKHWVPLMMEGKKFEANFHFKENFTDIFKWSVKLVI